MAVTATSLATDLVLVMDNGIGASGQALSQNRTFRSIKVSATDDDVYALAQTLIGLQSKTNNFIQRRNTVELESE
ncbi:MAG TPA: hypothetical protein DDZ44_00155 [Syntrophomonas wolfei]|uniref:DUF1659 domain-containing protein n=1 Tax=Syntrophomonas wolfei TaxID=863 RepID=A0A354YSP3_9FIRM|nr:hypothetical protein [Syntrophomonas wolfei]